MYHTNRCIIPYHQGDGVFAEAGECWDVDFMVKFNPKSQPDKYKLSEFTQPGQRKAVIKIDTDDDYMFQVRQRFKASSRGFS